MSLDRVILTCSGSNTPSSHMRGGPHGGTTPHMRGGSIALGPSNNFSCLDGMSKERGEERRIEND